MTVVAVISSGFMVVKKAEMPVVNTGEIDGGEGVQ